MADRADPFRSDHRRWKCRTAGVVAVILAVLVGADHVAAWDAPIAPPPREVVKPPAGGKPLHRWRIRFRFEDQQEYTRQLAAAGAVIFVPDEINGKKGTLFADLSNPQVGMPADIRDRIFAGRLALFEQDPKKVRLFLDHLGFKGQMTVYGVYFPKTFTDELAEKELAYRNRRVEQIEKTVFLFVLRDGRYEVEVLEQTAKE